MHPDVSVSDVHVFDPGMTPALDARQAIDELKPQLGIGRVVRADRPQGVLQDPRRGRIAVESHADIANAILQAITPVGKGPWNFDDSWRSRAAWDPLAGGIGARQSATRRGLALPLSDKQA
jgi:hypothetical protein